jgi:hypothetical protein
MRYISHLKQIEKRNAFFIFCVFAITTSAFCQENITSNYEIVEKSPLGYLPTDSKNLPTLVTTKKNKRDLAKLENTIDYLNANKKQKKYMMHSW